MESRRILGLLLIGLGLFMPSIINVNHFNVFQLLYQSSETGDGGLLLLAASSTVFLNTIRAVPHYTGAFLLGEEIRNTWKTMNLPVLLVPFLVIPLVYYLIQRIYGISYDFGGPAILSLLIITAIYLGTHRIKNIPVKVFIITLFIFGFQWLDTVPLLTSFGFGHGEISYAIKELGLLIGADRVLNFYGLTFAAVIIFNATIISRLVITYYHQLRILNEKREKELELKQVKIELVKSRALKEMQHLVHDLKTPLTTIQGLSGVIEYRSCDSKIMSYARKINSSVEMMSQVISEIIHEDVRTAIETEEIISFIRSQLAISSPVGEIYFHNEVRGHSIPINKIRFTRGVINLIDNALQALEENKEDPVEVSFSEEGGNLKVEVKDRGEGIPQRDLENIWRPGFSNTSSSGLGLNYVQQMVENHRGHITLKSREGEGTAVIMEIPGLKKEDYIFHGQEEDSHY